MEKGYLCLVLHAHLPYVRHPEHEHFLEENWLYEAITETYIPLIEKFDKLIEEGVDFRLTMTMSPPLISMLRDSLLQERYLKHIHRLLELANKEVERTQQHEPWMLDNALFYKDIFERCIQIFEHRYNRDLVSAFKKFQDLGKLEIITCGATHGFLPMMQVNEKAVRSQIAVAAAHYQEVFGRGPRGIWLPECGYYPGVENILKDYGIKFFFVDTHGILYGNPRPKYGVFAPVFTENGVAAFGRDVESSKSVWSAKEGYPGDYNYRDFYRDIGFDLDLSYIKPYIHPDGIRVFTGMKYYKITGETEHKEPYNRQRAMELVADHAANFMYNREKQAEYLHSFLEKKPIIVSPYDAELFGHWWFEGPEFLDVLIRKIYYDQNTIRLITPIGYLQENPKNQVVTPSMSSWGYKGYCEVWLNDTNDWIYKHLHEISNRMNELASSHPHADGLLRQALNQSARELLLAQSSDWAFILKTGTMVEYAVKRTKDHINNFLTIYDQIQTNQINGEYINSLESKNNIFPNINYLTYAT